MNNLSKYQVESVVIDRSSIKNAPYNPRKISPKAEKELRKNIKERGLMGGIVVNRTTMHLVAGHQRLSQLDILEKSQDYQIRVEMVSLSEREEKEQNIFMNNRNVMGEFDEDLLKTLIPDIDPYAAGLDDYDLNMLGVMDIHTEPEAESVMQEFEELQKPVEAKKEHVKEMKKQFAEKSEKSVMEGESYFMMSFESYENKAAFMRRFGFDPMDKFIKGEVFENLIEYVGE